MAPPFRQFPQFLRPAFQIAVLVAIAAASRAETPDDPYFPLRTGDQRISDVLFLSPLGKTEQSTLTVTVNEKAERGGKLYYRVRFLIEGANARDYVRLTRKDKTGVYAVDEADPTATEAMEILRPLKSGTVQFIGPGNMEMKVTVVGQEPVDAGGKTFQNCFHLRMIPSSGAFTRDLWLAPEVGAVKSETLFGNGGRMAVTLREFTSGGK